MHKHILDSLKKSDDYKMAHTSPSPDGGAPLHDMTQVFPSDIYSKDAARFYPHGSEKKMDRDSIKIIHSVKGNPDAKVFVHRAVPKDVNVINPGDWVSINKDYAKEHGENKLDGNFHILSQEVPAKEIYTSDSIHEQGWHPTKMQKSESEEDSNPKVSFSLGLGKHRQLRHFLSHEPEQKASKQKLKENGFDVQQMGYNPKLDSKGFLHHDHVHNKIENEPKMSFEFGLGRFNHENVPDEAKQYYHLKNFKPENYNVSPDDEEGMSNAIAQHMESFDPEKDHSQRHSNETSQVFHLNATPDHIQKMKDEGVFDTFQNMMDVERRSGHPNQGHTVGWVRFTHDNHEDPNKSGYHMDEIQNDLSHSWIDQTVAQVEEGLRTKQITPLQAQRIHDNATKSFPDEHLKKINDILFEGHHPNDVLHESFLQHLRDKGESGKQIHLWQAAPKAKMSDMDTEKALPGHMTHTYHKSPSKMGYKPSVYGELATQNGEHFGEPTWKHTLVKKEDYQSNAKKGLMLSFPATINGKKYRPDMPGIHYHSTIRQFDTQDNTSDDVHKQASMIELTPPHEDTGISFGHLTGRDGSKHHVIFLNGDYENKVKEYRNKIQEKNPVKDNYEYKSHISVDHETWNELKFKNPKTLKEAGIEFGNAEIHHGPEKTHTFGRIEGDLHKSETYESESKKIRENKKLPEASKSHKFKKAKWTYPNGHPRCIICGSEEMEDGVCRPNLEKSEEDDKQTLLNKLSQTTEKRKLPCGQIGFLMHRGMDNQEYNDNHVGGKTKYDKQILDWTPDYQKAKIDADKVVSAWIPENSIVGSKDDSYNVDSEGAFYHAHPEIVKKNMFLKD